MTVPVLLPRRWRLVDILSFFNLYYGLADLAVLWLGLAWLGGWLRWMWRMEASKFRLPTAKILKLAQGYSRSFMFGPASTPATIYLLPSFPVNNK